jgi:hypothetical protein
MGVKNKSFSVSPFLEELFVRREPMLLNMIEKEIQFYELIFLSAN